MPNGYFRYWFGCLNNPQRSLEDQFDQWNKSIKCKWIIGQVEQAETTGTIHIQFLAYTERVTLAQAKEIFGNEAHIEGKPVSAKKDCVDYVTKEKTRVHGPYAVGIKLPTKKPDWDQIRTSAIAGKLDEVPSEVFIKSYHNLKAISRDNQQPSEEASEPKGIWIWGDPGVGKSFMVRRLFQPIFLKPLSKWWDLYKGEKYVLMDDVDMEHKWLSSSLKIWADQYPCIGEIKGGSIQLQHQKFFVTSNYPISAIWNQDVQLQKALERRFKEIWIKDRATQQKYLNGEITI